MIGNGQAFLASERFRAVFQALAVPRRFSAGENVFLRGEPARGIFLVSSGRVSLSVGDEADSKDAGPGSALGLPAIIARTDYMLSARALEHTELGFVPREQFLDRLAAQPDLSFEVVRILGTEVQNASHVIVGQLRNLESFAAGSAVAAYAMCESHTVRHSIGLRQARQLLSELKEGYDALSSASRGIIARQLEICAERQALCEETSQQH